MSLSESIILWTGVVIGLLTIIAGFVFGGCFLLEIIRIFVPNFLRTKEDAPQPAAVPKRTIVHNCPFCGTPYDTWNKPEAGKLRFCYHCKRNCYSDGSILGLNEVDKLTLASEAEDCRQVNTGTYDNLIDQIIQNYHNPSTTHPSDFFVDVENDAIWVNRGFLTALSWKLIPPLSSKAGQQALAFRSKIRFDQALKRIKGDLYKYYSVSDIDRGFTVRQTS